MALFDDIKAQLDNQAPAQATPNYQAIATKLLAAKSGKVASGPATAPAASQLGQTAAVAAASDPLGSKVQGLLGSQALGAQAVQQRAEQDQAQQALSAQRQQSYADLAAGQQKGAMTRQAQEQEATSGLLAQKNINIAQTTAAYQQGLDRLASDRRISENDLFTGFRHGNQELSQRADAAQLESLAQTMALRDEAYVDNLQRVGDLSGLRDDAAFRREYIRVQNDNNEELTNLFNGWAVQFNDNKNGFNEMISGMDVDSAMKNYTTVAQAEGEAQMVKGGIKIGESAYAAKKEGEKK